MWRSTAARRNGNSKWGLPNCRGSPRNPRTLLGNHQPLGGEDQREELMNGEGKQNMKLLCSLETHDLRVSWRWIWNLPTGRPFRSSSSHWLWRFPCVDSCCLIYQNAYKNNGHQKQLDLVSGELSPPSWVSAWAGEVARWSLIFTGNLSRNRPRNRLPGASSASRSANMASIRGVWLWSPRAGWWISLLTLCQCKRV